MTEKEIFMLDANKHQVLSIDKLYRGFVRLINKAELSKHDLYSLADVIEVPRGVMWALKRNKLDDMTFTDYHRLHQLIFDTSLKTINEWLSRPVKDIDCPEEFIEQVNENVEEPKIDTTEAICAKKIADKDIEKYKEQQSFTGSVNINGKKYNINTDNIKDVKKVLADALNDYKSDNKEAEKLQNDTRQKYDKAVKEAQMELFGDTELLDKKTLPELQSYIYTNDWDGEFDEALINHRQSVLLFLYRKLTELSEVKMKKNVGLTKENISDLNKSKEYAKAQYKKGLKKAEKKQNKSNPKPKNNEDAVKQIFDMLNSFGFNFH